MKYLVTKKIGLAFGLSALLAATAQAQPSPGFGGFGGTSSTTTRSSSSRNSTYPNSTDIGQARITYDPETRRLIVVADDDTATHIKDVVAQLDRPTPQALIKCVFLEATYANGTDIGAEGTYTHTISTKNASAINGSGIASTAFDLATSGGIYQLFGEDIEATFVALSKAGKTEILSRPSILARNNQQARINIGQRVPLITGTVFDQFGNERNTIAYEDVGIILDVTPFIASDGMVEMIVAPEISSVSDSFVGFGSGTNTSSANSTAPVINVRSADTVVVVPDGQTVVIGGLMQTLKTKSEQKVPILGDIPLLGMLFKHKVTADEKKELLIFMTPRIINHPAELAAQTAYDEKNRGVSREAFGDEELNKYLDRLPNQENTSTGKTRKKK